MNRKVVIGIGLALFLLAAWLIYSVINFKFGGGGFIKP